MISIQIATIKRTTSFRRCFCCTLPQPCERNTVIQQNRTYSSPCFCVFFPLLPLCTHGHFDCIVVPALQDVGKRKESTTSQNDNCKRNTASTHLYSRSKDEEETDAKQRSGANPEVNSNKTCECHCASAMDMHVNCVYIHLSVGVEVSVHPFLNRRTNL